jgi:hypothetical protein
MGISTDNKKDNHYLDLQILYSDQILKGRELNGEERSFDF